MTRRIVIKDGVAAGFVDEVNLPLEAPRQRRVSHVVPRNSALRALFETMRAWFGETGRVADWTRSWKCDWLVRIGDDEHGPFVTRDAAIRFEKALVSNSGLIDQYLGTDLAKSAAGPA